MNSKRNVLLLVVFLGLLAYMIRGELPKDKAKSLEGQRLVDMPRKAIISLTVKNSAGEFKLRNTDPQQSKEDSELGFDTDKWQLDGVVGSRLDPAGVGRLISNMKELRFSEPIPSAELEADLSIYGLANPPVVVTWQGKDTEGKERAIGVEIGSLNKYVSKRYARIVGEPEVYLVADGIFGAANRGSSDFRLKNPVSFADSDVAKIEFKRGAEQFEFVETTAGWDMLQPFKATASKLAVADILRGFRNLQVNVFVDSPEEVKKLGFDKARYALKVQRKDKAEIVVRIAEKKNEQSALQAVFQIEGEPGAYISNSVVPSELTVEADKLRERRLFSFEWDRATKVSLELASDKLELTKVGEEWTLDGKPADAVFVKELLRQWGTVEAKAFPATTVKAGQLGFDKPTAKMTVAFDGDRPTPQVFVVGAKFKLPSKSKATKIFNYYAARGDLSEPFTVDEESVLRLMPKRDALLKLTPPADEAAAKE